MDNSENLNVRKVDPLRHTKYLLFPLGARLITECGAIYRYMFDGTDYLWMEERKWEKIDKSVEPEKYFNPETLTFINNLYQLVKDGKLVFDRTEGIYKWM